MPHGNTRHTAKRHFLPLITENRIPGDCQSFAHPIRKLFLVVIAENRQLRLLRLQPTEQRHNPFVMRVRVNIIADQADEIRFRSGGEFVHDAVEEDAAGRAVEVRVADDEDREAVPFRRQVRQRKCEFSAVEFEDRTYQGAGSGFGLCRRR